MTRFETKSLRAHPARTAGAGPGRAASRTAGSLFLPAALLAASLAAAPALAAAVPASGAGITEVTVFPDRAEIVREARVDLPAGASTVEFAEIPWGVEPDSLRVSASGVPATLGAVELRERADDPRDNPDLIAARDELRRIEGEITALDAESKNAQTLHGFLEALKAAAARTESDRLAEGRADPASIQALYSLIRTNLGDLTKEDLSRRQKRERLLKDLEVARAKLSAARPAGAIRTRVAAVEVEARRAGALTLRLAYVAPGASWRPAYRASLDAATGEIALASEAVVRQSTGEDWSGVALRLSTAAPARGVRPPALSSWMLRPYEPRPIAAKAGAGVAMANVGLERVGTDVDHREAMQEVPILGRNYRDRLDLDEAKSAAAPAEIAEAAVVHSAYNVAFEVPGRSGVASDNSDHRVVLRQETLAGQVRYRAVPALNAAAFLQAKTTAPSGYPLLAGSVRVFAGGAYLGSSHLQETAPGAEFDLPFGVDNRVKIERTPLPQSRTQEGFGGKTRRVSYAFRTTVENLRDRAVTVVLEDRVPVSEDERVQIERGKGTTPGAVEVRERPGVLEWTLELKAGEKREIVLEYAVSHPRELVVPGLD